MICHISLSFYTLYFQILLQNHSLSSLLKIIVRTVEQLITYLESILQCKALKFTAFWITSTAKREKENHLCMVMLQPVHVYFRLSNIPSREINLVK